MENKNMRKLNVTVQCMAVYNSSILRYQDIQALDEEEFLLRVRELIRVEQDERLPF